MNTLTIAWKSIKERRLASALTALSVALGVTLLVSVLVINGIIDKMFNQTASGYDLVVGAQGSKLQLILSTVFRVGAPIENLPYRYYEEIKKDPRIEEAIPFAIGDVTQKGGFPIVGTIPRYFALEYIPGRHFRINKDGKFLPGTWDAVIGSAVARQNNWKMGDEFQLIHGSAEAGHVHDEKFKIVGILAPTGTPNDRTVFVNLRGFYQVSGHEKPLDEALKREAAFFGEKLDEEKLKALMKEQAAHDHHDHSGHDHGHGHDHEVPDAQKEVTAILVQMKGDRLRGFSTIKFQSELQEANQAMAVNPIRQISWLMQNIVGNVRTMLVVLTSLIIIVSGVSIFVSIYNSMADRKREIAIMRALGAGRTTVFAIILSESVLLCLGGGILGILLGHGLVFVAAPIIEARSGLLINPLAFNSLELVLLPILIVLASLVGFIPAMTAYRTDVASTLSDT
ncbi:ABC transporter permease [Gimesia chilikensis]|uniref:ABC transporter permease YtrF n=1 Tax=Gimesia chilikensis TaxID=2605989 RepID=A0A517PGT0_9PLAN|nr:ABC transporter permease [Gimesia chilikensis]QDT18575.1 ABC transporter permease YtrF precursor [Gimesia chilikensis]QDT82703.1 ABC transporter permease YtrF precursor [Gimesia chilikensis]QDU00646.1 ABC transporter permease YtrF precursor [Gimesia chilikensis]